MMIATDASAEPVNLQRQFPEKFERGLNPVSVKLLNLTRATNAAQRVGNVRQVRPETPRGVIWRKVGC